MEPFWPRRSPHFLACRRAVRAAAAAAGAAAAGAAESNPTAPIVIGLSGGADSLALVAAAAAERIPARAVVVDHQLQPGSAEVAERAAEQARSLGIPAEVIRVDVGEGNVEAAAREARYAALAAAAAASAATAATAASPEVWVAHTADDQAETLLLGALRGNPAGMAHSELREAPSLTAPAPNPTAPAPNPTATYRLVRPFLHIRRADTIGACEELGLEYWSDPMNDDIAYRRVAIRRQIIPALSDLLGGDAVAPLADASNRIAADRDLIAAITNLAPTADCGELAGDEGVIRRRRLAAWLLAHDVPVQGAQLDAIEALVTDWRGQGPIAVAGGAVARRDGRLVFEPNAR